MSAKREIPTLRLAGAVLCVAASLLLLLSSVYLFAREGRGLPLLLVGVGLLLAAVKSLRPH